jgi:hypothetical protein
MRHVGLTLSEQAALARAPRREPAQQWWNVPAKYEAAKRIEREILARFPSHNDAGDALRHAELSRRLATEIGPVSSAIAGFTHELENSIGSPPPGALDWLPPRVKEHIQRNWRGQGQPERDMDLHNNLEGLRAAARGQPVDPGQLQVKPVARQARPARY